MQLGYALVGCVVGVVVGLTSTGGGSLLTPALLFFGAPPALAIGSDVLVASGMKLFGGSFYALRREVHWPTVLKLGAGSIPGAALGIAVLNRVPREWLDTSLRRGVGVVLVLAGLATVRRVFLQGKAHPERFPSAAITVLLGAVTGILVSMSSIGSGSLLLCVMTALFPLSAQKIVGTDLVHALLLSAVAAIGHYLAGRVDLGLSLALLVGAIPGVLIGARLAWAMPQRALRVALGVVLVGIGAQLSLVAPSKPAAPVVATVAGARP